MGTRQRQSSYCGALHCSYNPNAESTWLAKHEHMIRGSRGSRGWLGIAGIYVCDPQSLFNGKAQGTVVDLVRNRRCQVPEQHHMTARTPKIGNSRTLFLIWSAGALSRCLHPHRRIIFEKGRSRALCLRRFFSSMIPRFLLKTISFSNLFQNHKKNKNHKKHKKQKTKKYS